MSEPPGTDPESGDGSGAGGVIIAAPTTVGEPPATAERAATEPEAAGPDQPVLPDAVATAPRRRTAPRVSRKRLLDVGVPLGLMVGTGLSRLPNLERPSAFVFDEVYYSLEASDMLRRGVEQGPVVHPPVGKWLIAGGIELFGYTPFGWRFASLVAGCFVVLFTYLAARQIVRGYLLPALAGLLVAVDGVEFTVGRIAQLDVFVALFVSLGVWLLIMAVRHPGNRRRVRWCCWGVGVAMALAGGTKWAFAAFPITVCLLVFLVLDLTTPGVKWWRAVPATLTALAILPAAAFVGFHVPWMVQVTETNAGATWCSHHEQSPEVCDPGVLDRLEIWRTDQKRIYDFHRELRPKNPFAVPAWNWAVLDGPVKLFQKTCYPGVMNAPADLNDGACRGAAPGDRMEIAAIPNPAVWAPAMVALPVALLLSLRRKRPSLIGPVLVLMAASLWVPYLLNATQPWLLEARDSYTFYMSPLVPVAVLALVYVLDQAGGKLRWTGAALAVVAVAAFLFYYPIWAGIPLDPDSIRAREFWRAW